MTLETELAELSRTLHRVVRRATPGSVSGDAALSIVHLFSEIERAAASGTALFTPRVLQAGSYSKQGYASAPDWLGAVSGSSASAARNRLAAAERAASSPEISGALHGGELSNAQLKIVTDIAAVAPDAPKGLLSMAADGASNQELSDAASRIRAAARKVECERAQRARVHAHRHFRWRQDEAGGIRSEIYCDEAQWARFFPVLEAEAKTRFKAAGAGAGDSLEAHRLDAFIDLMARAGGSGGSRSAAHHRAVVIVDAEALRRGTSQGDELCEIDGVGPVSVETATELLGDAGLQFVIKDGANITTVTGTSRAIAQRINTALLVRDRTCVVPGCGKRHGLERDHYMVDFKDDGPTEFANLARLCAAHHDMKTNGGWKLGGGPGRWTWNPPPKPPSAGRISRNRRLTAAKARRDKPLRT
jgi:hypothetical protein